MAAGGAYDARDKATYPNDEPIYVPPSESSSTRKTPESFYFFFLFWIMSYLAYIDSCVSQTREF